MGRLYSKYRSFCRLRFLTRMYPFDMAVLILMASVGISAFLFLVTPPLFGKVDVGEDEWSKIEPFFAVITLAFAGAASFIALKELSESTDSRNLGVYQDIFIKFMSNDAIEARRMLYRNIPDGPEDERIAVVMGNDELRECVKEVMNQLDYFGFLVERAWVTSDEIIGWLSPIIVKVWEKIGPIVEYERANRQEEPDYYISAVNLAERCQKWRDKHYPQRQAITFDDKRL